MTAPRTLIVCMSIHHQNTARVASAIAGILHADIRSPAEISPQTISDYDLIGFGSGIYFGQFHAALRKWIDDIPSDLRRHQNAFVFSTAGLPSLWWLWQRSIEPKLRKKGFDVVDGFHCSGFDTVGPLRLLGGLNRRHPDDRDLANAQAFALQLLTKLSDADTANTLLSSL